MALRPAISLVLRELLSQSETSRALTLDAVATSLGTIAASADDVEALFAALEAEGRTITDADVTASPKADLVDVLRVARELTRETGARPNPAAIAARAGMSEGRVRAALRFATLMAR